MTLGRKYKGDFEFERLIYSIASSVETVDWMVNGCTKELVFIERKLRRAANECNVDFMKNNQRGMCE